MLPSSTVENYLKAIHEAQNRLPSDRELVPMGQLSSALGVVPGTATTMVKTLAESGLVVYEPYSGVRLTAAGTKLAAAVLRRHRLVELFLVRVMGMSWDEVHDEAEQLEHAVSDRLIERIDEMLGRPAVDPHGDPIPDAEGQIQTGLESYTLLTCAIGVPLVVSRVLDQDGEFLRFVEHSALKPGQPITVVSRDAAADRVIVRVSGNGAAGADTGAGADAGGNGGREIALGTRAASKLLVERPR